MDALTVALLPALAKSALTGRLPAGIDTLWWEDGEQLVELAPQAEIGWFDMFEKARPLKAMERATGLKWLNTAFAGVDWLPLEDFQVRGVKLTNGSGLNAGPVAEFAVLSMLAVARGYTEIVRAQDAHDWLSGPPGTVELAGSRALILGYGEIGRAVHRMLAGFEVEVVPVTRSGRDGTLGPDEWQAQLGTFDWVVLAMPGTPDTAKMIDADVLAAMKTCAVLVNVARADIVDQDALVAALRAGKIGGAVLDLTDPEPLPADHPLWDVPNCHVTMHLAGMPTQRSFLRAVDRFVLNCSKFMAGEALESEVDLALGY